MLHQITDWSDAYANGANIPRGDRWPDLWVEPARAYRDAMTGAGRARLGLSYGSGERNKLDLFLPEGTPKGLVVFVHGGFWVRLDNSYWSHLAAGPIAHGYAVAMPPIRSALPIAWPASRAKSARPSPSPPAWLPAPSG